MTGWHLLAGYSILGMAYVAGSMVMHFFGALNRPATDGHLDFRFKLDRFGKWFVTSAILTAPIAIAYATVPSRSYEERLMRSNLILTIYMIIALAWITKLQFQINKINKQADS